MIKPEDKVIEECSELIHAICKAKRFGLFNHHPDTPDISNCEQIKREMDDVIEAIEKLNVIIHNAQYSNLHNK